MHYQLGAMPMLGLPGRGMGMGAMGMPMGGGGRGPFQPNVPPEKHDPAHYRSLANHGYQIVKVLGSGNFGCVYLVRSTTGREYAAKVMRADERNLKEIALLRQLATSPHPNLVHYDSAWHEPTPKGPMAYLIMEYCPGGDLERLKPPLPPQQAVSVILQICAGLSHLHARNITHRDVKEANILIAGDGTLRLTDFGISKQASHFDPSSTVVGTPPYMAPEILDGLTAGRARGAPYGPAVDKWSAGVLFYRLVSGKHPYASPAQALSRRPPAALPPSVDRSVARLIMALLSFSPQKRPDLRSVPALLGIPSSPQGGSGGTPPPSHIGASPSAGGSSSGQLPPHFGGPTPPPSTTSAAVAAAARAAPPNAGRRRASSSGGGAPPPTASLSSPGAPAGQGGRPAGLPPTAGGRTSPGYSHFAGVDGVGSGEVVPPSLYRVPQSSAPQTAQSPFSMQHPSELHHGVSPYAPAGGVSPRRRSSSQPTGPDHGHHMQQVQCAKCLAWGHDADHHPCSSCGAIGHASYECPGVEYAHASPPATSQAGQFCGICSRPGHVAERHPCRTCGGFGHASAECPNQRW